MRLESQFWRMNCQMFSWLLSSGERGGKRSSRLGVLSHGRAMQIGFRRPRDRLTRCRYPRPSWVVLRPRDGADRSFAGVEEIKHRTPSMPISCLPISAQPKRAPLPTTAAVARCWPRPPSNALGPRIPKAKFWTSGSRRGLDRDQRQVPTRCANLALVAGAFFLRISQRIFCGCYGALGWRAATL